MQLNFNINISENTIQGYKCRDTQNLQKASSLNLYLNVTFSLALFPKKLYLMYILWVIVGST